MNTSYRQVFNFEVLHQYFSNGRCENLQFIPSNNTLDIMSNGGIIFSVSNGQLRIAIDQGYIATLRLMLADNEGELTLGFKVFNDDKINQYHQLQLVDPKTQLHFSYTYLSSSLAKNTNFLISNQDQWVTDNDFIHREKIRTPELLSSKKDAINNFFFSVNLIITANMLDDIDNFNAFEYQRLAVQFKAPQNIWKYYVPCPKFYSGLFIVDLDNTITFEPLGIEIMPNGQQAITYISDAPLNVIQHSDYRFQLKSDDDSGDRAKILINRLPVAAVTNFYMDIINETPTVISEIYVNF